MKRVVAGVISAMIIASAWIATYTHINAPTCESEATRYIALAEKQCAHGTYGSAIRLYQRALSLEDSAQLRLKLAETWMLYGNETAFRNELKELIRAYPMELQAYELLAGHYYECLQFTKCCDAIQNAQYAGVESELLDNIFRKSAYRYDILKEEYESAGVFNGGYALVNKEGELLIINSDRKIINNCALDEADAFFGSTAAVTIKGVPCFIDKDGGKYMAIDEIYTSLRSYSEGRAVVEWEGRFGYIDIFGDRILGEYEFASTFSCGVAAVCDEYGWYLIDTDGNPLKDKRYEEIALDENSTIGCGEFCFVKQGGYWYMLDIRRDSIGKTKYEDVRAPADDTVAAVKQNGMWGFADRSGSMIIKPTFDDASAFSYGLAAVKMDGIWGYIDRKGIAVIDFIFEEAKCFADNGMAPVKIDGRWKYIKLKYRENFK